MAKIICNKDLFNGGRCFSKNKEYTVDKKLFNNASLIDATVTNDQNEPHRIGSWWRNFRII